MKTSGVRRPCRRSVSVVAALLLFSAQTPRIASDFEIAQTQKQLAAARDYLAQIAGHLNLGDLRMTRNETALAQREYGQAYEIAATQRVAARRGANLAQYANATAYAGLAQAKLGDAASAFALFEEALRYASDDAKTWNLYATAMSLAGRHAKAIAAERNAVSIAGPHGLDAVIYHYALANFLGAGDESEELLRGAIDELQSPAFDAVRREVARREAFEVYSTADDEVSAYVSVLNRTQLRLARLYEDRGDTARARALYEAVLRTRNDDPAALAGVARLSRTERDYAAAFDANPFSPALIRDYQQYVRQAPSPVIDESTPGALMRRAIRGDRRALAELQKRYPDATIALPVGGQAPSPVLSLARGQAGAPVPPQELRALLTYELTPEDRKTLDTLTLTAIATFAPTSQPSVFETGTIGDVKFRFSEPMAFSGNFAAGVPLKLTFRILGVSDDALLLEPIKVEQP
jgi:tetratricopeptide (TPR) repeat protein